MASFHPMVVFTVLSFVNSTPSDIDQSRNRCAQIRLNSSQELWTEKQNDRRLICSMHGEIQTDGSCICNTGFTGLCCQTRLITPQGETISSSSTEPNHAKRVDTSTSASSPSTTTWNLWNWELNQEADTGRTLSNANNNNNLEPMPSVPEDRGASLKTAGEAKPDLPQQESDKFLPESGSASESDIDNLKALMDSHHQSQLVNGHLPFLHSSGEAGDILFESHRLNPGRDESDSDSESDTESDNESDNDSDNDNSGNNGDNANNENSDNFRNRYYHRFFTTTTLSPADRMVRTEDRRNLVLLSVVVMLCIGFGMTCLALQLRYMRRRQRRHVRLLDLENACRINRQIMAEAADIPPPPPYEEVLQGIMMPPSYNPSQGIAQEQPQNDTANRVPDEEAAPPVHVPTTNDASFSRVQTTTASNSGHSMPDM